MTAPMDLSSDQFTRLEQSFLRSVSRFYPSAGNDGLRQAQEGSIQAFDALCLADLLRAQKPETILEIGSFLGFSTRWILEVCQPWQPRVRSVDPGIRHRSFNNASDHLLSFNRPFIEQGALSLTRAFFSLPGEDLSCYLHDYGAYHPRLDIETAMQTLDSVGKIAGLNEACDFYFIDGDHSRAATSANVTSCLRSHATSGRSGTIVVHGAVAWPEVVPGILQALVECPRMVNPFYVVGCDDEGSFLDLYQQNRFVRKRATVATNIKSNGLAVLKLAPAV